MELSGFVLIKSTCACCCREAKASESRPAFVEIAHP